MCRTFGKLARLTLIQLVLRIRIRDPGIRYFFDPWISDPGSQTHIFESLVTIFWVKCTLPLSEFCSNFFLHLFPKKIIIYFVKIETQKR
jgi:hypothetical protein